VASFWRKPYLYRSMRSSCDGWNTERIRGELVRATAHMARHPNGNARHYEQ
jgi:phage-related protein